MNQSVNRWLAVVIGIIFLSVWLAGCQAPARKDTKQQPAKPPAQTTQTPSQVSVIPRLDPGKKPQDVDRANLFTEKLLHDLVGNEARSVVGDGYPDQGGFAIEVRFNAESVDKEQLRNKVQAIYRAMVEQFPGHLIRLQVNPFYTAEYKNGQPVERPLITTYMDADTLYTTNWDKEAYPWQCRFYDKTQVDNLPCDQQKLGTPYP